MLLLAASPPQDIRQLPEVLVAANVPLPPPPVVVEVMEETAWPCPAAVAAATVRAVVCQEAMSSSLLRRGAALTHSAKARGRLHKLASACWGSGTILWAGQHTASS
jgi:hypothetical protein